MIQISVKSRHFNCAFELHKKITVIQGQSGTGKSRLYKAIADGSGAYKLSVSDDYEPVALPSKHWYQLIDYNIQKENNCVYFIDDADYVISGKFTEILNRDSHSFYVIINRCTNLKSLAQLPFCAGEIYEMISNGTEHYLQTMSITY